MRRNQLGQVSLTLAEQEQQLKQYRLSQQQIFRYVAMQWIASMVFAIVLLSVSLTVAYSALIGGAIASFTNSWFAYKVFKQKPSDNANNILATFYVGEAYKLLLTSAFFIIALVTVKPLNMMVLLASYFIVHIIPALQNVFEKKRSKSRE